MAGKAIPVATVVEILLINVRLPDCTLLDVDFMCPLFGIFQFINILKLIANSYSAYYAVTNKILPAKPQNE